MNQEVQRRLANVLDARRNSFNLVRLIAACAVVASHSFSIPTGMVSAEPLAALSPFTLGQHAVNAFFVISGLTLSQTLSKHGDLANYAWHRLLRIFPALFFFGVLFALVAGPLLTAAPLREYFGDGHTWVYPLSVMIEFARATPPHGLFGNVPYAGAANNPLWTLKYELAAYIGLAIFFSLGLLSKSWATIFALAASACLLVLFGPMPQDDIGAAWTYQMSRYAFCFLLGVAAYRLRDKIPLAPVFMLLPLAVAVGLRGTPLSETAFIVLVAHLVLVMGGRTYGGLTVFTSKSDLSYGIYIYGWPVAQAIMSTMPGLHPLSLMALSFAIVPLFAILSWHLVEKPALSLKRFDVRTFTRPLFLRNE